jgi:copper homeostasis protein
VTRVAEGRIDVLLEACVTTLDEAVGAVRGGAHRLELCTELEVGGLTPPFALLRDVKGAVTVPVFSMIRLRPGSFETRRGDGRALAEGIAAARAAGADGIVVGVLDREGRVDGATLARLVAAAGPLPVTFHRAFDAVSDRRRALQALVDAGVSRVLTGGGPGKAWEGRGALAESVRDARGRLTVLAAGGIRADHARALAADVGLREIHARAEAFPALAGALARE